LTQHLPKFIVTTETPWGGGYVAFHFMLCHFGFAERLGCHPAGVGATGVNNGYTYGGGFMSL